jgi:hypothetical protein
MHVRHKGRFESNWICTGRLRSRVVLGHIRNFKSDHSSILSDDCMQIPGNAMPTSQIWELIGQLHLQQRGSEHQEQQQQYRGRVICPGLSPQDISQAAVLQQAQSFAAVLCKAIHTAHAHDSSSSGMLRPALVALLIPRSLDCVVSSIACLAAG